MRPSRQLAVLAAIFVVLAALVWFGGSGGWRDRLEPKLGLDLIGGATGTLQATKLEGGKGPHQQHMEDGKPPTQQQMETARRIIDQRVNGLGVSEAEVVVEGNTNIVVSLPGKSD